MLILRFAPYETSTRSIPPGVGGGHAFRHPVLAKNLVGHLDHDVVGFEQAVVQVVAVAREALPCDADRRLRIAGSSR